MSLAITLLLAMTVFMILVADMIPPTSEVVPIVGVFFNAAMVEMVIMLIVLCLVSKLYNKEPTDPPMPMWMRKYFLEKLSYIIGVRRRPRPSSPSSQIATTEMRYLAGDANQNQQDTKSLLRSSASNMLQTPGNGFVAKNVLPNSGMYSTVDGTLSKSEEFQALSKKMDKVVEKIDDDEKDAKIKEEWRIVAMTIDKIFLCFFTLLIIITAIFCFLQAPEYVP